MFFFMTTNKKQQCYPLWCFSWRPKKNDSVTPHVLFDKKDNVTPYVLMDKYPQWGYMGLLKYNIIVIRRSLSTP